MIQVVAERQDSAISLLCRFSQRRLTAPGLDDGAALEVGAENLIPPDHRLAVFLQQRLNAEVEVSVQGGAVGKLVLARKLLNGRRVSPLRVLHLISANMKET